MALFFGKLGGPVLNIEERLKRIEEAFQKVEKKVVEEEDYRRMRREQIARALKVLGYDDNCIRENLDQFYEYFEKYGPHWPKNVEDRVLPAERSNGEGE
jgi:hypothetical protein